MKGYPPSHASRITFIGSLWLIIWMAIIIIIPLVLFSSGARVWHPLCLHARRGDTHTKPTPSFPFIPYTASINSSFFFLSKTYIARPPPLLNLFPKKVESHCLFVLAVKIPNTKIFEQNSMK